MKNITTLFSFMFTTCTLFSQIPANDLCTNAISLTLGAACTAGTNVLATVSAGEAAATLGAGPNNCWETAASNTVWYTFTTTAAGPYLVTTTGGAGAVGSRDTQIKIISGTCAAPTVVGCSEDWSGPTNGLGAAASSYLDAATTYLVQVDVYGATTGTFCISVASNPVPTNDCILNATDITAQIDGLSTTNLFDCATFTYNAAGAGPSRDPLQTILAGDPNGCNGSLIVVGVPAQVPNSDHRDVWFKFTVSGSTPPAWLSLYQQTGNLPNYSTALYSGTPGGTCGETGSITGMTQIDCSAGEYVDAVLPGSNIDGGARDKANCTTPIHPRLDVSGLANGTYYFRVWESFGGAPSDGIFNLCAEKATPANVTSDQCPSQNTVGCADNLTNRDFTQTYTDAGNNGMMGNSCNTTPNEPQLASGAAGEVRDNCGGPWMTYVGYANNVMNNSAIYQFTVDATPPCVANVILEFSNIQYGGTDGKSAQIQVMNGTCAGGTSAVMTGVTTDPCFRMRPSGGTLPNGTYYIVVDGQDGQLLQYDMNLSITHTGAGCTAVTCGTVILSVDLVEFNGTRIQGTRVNLDWTTLGEKNNDYYEVERSINGFDFENVGYVKGYGNTKSQANYKFNDNVSEHIENVYYRLKQIDFDGNYAYSNTIVLDYNSTKVISYKYYNLLGQEVDLNAKGVLIQISSDGKKVTRINNL